jgi:hypothetical protein
MSNLIFNSIVNDMFDTNCRWNQNVMAQLCFTVFEANKCFCLFAWFWMVKHKNGIVEVKIILLLLLKVIIHIFYRVNVLNSERFTTKGELATVAMRN